MEIEKEVSNQIKKEILNLAKIGAEKRLEEQSHLANTDDTKEKIENNLEVVKRWRIWYVDKKPR